MFQGTAWIGVVDDGGEVATTYNVTAGQVIFFPKNTLHWIKNVGDEDCFFLLFFSTHDELQTLDVDDVFFSTPEDIASRSLKVCTTSENTSHHILCRHKGSMNGHLCF
jgi:oxalate decarboxylase/phosphoglucose isomerase-like protein (cupin superfamily)